jgi:hypothetical protein
MWKCMAVMYVDIKTFIRVLGCTLQGTATLHSGPQQLMAAKE